MDGNINPALTSLNNIFPKKLGEKKMTKIMIDQCDLFERVTLPLGSISRTLEYLLKQSADIDPKSLQASLRLVQANAETAYSFLLGEIGGVEHCDEPRTPEQLRLLVALMTGRANVPMNWPINTEGGNKPTPR